MVNFSDINKIINGNVNNIDILLDSDRLAQQPANKENIPGVTFHRYMMIEHGSIFEAMACVMKCFRGKFKFVSGEAAILGLQVKGAFLNLRLDELTWGCRGNSKKMHNCDL
ncbi:hypothetical protein NQ318_010252 [Aromia moschata]|uniref:Uncharacterized protein n=1 Tax=Aromia moschata TaxID=1265417 RepID=A0AAV8YJS2_9CUCU|nr:hypothetical protein NQ318_010252 [Aromia moschata]